MHNTTEGGTLINDKKLMLLYCKGKLCTNLMKHLN